MTKATIQERFELYHAANPHVYAMYIEYTKQLLRLGHRRISPQFILERIRWEMTTGTVPTKGSGWHAAGGKPFKINDHFSSRYARLLIKQYPRLGSVFETRTIKTP